MNLFLRDIRISALFLLSLLLPLTSWAGAINESEARERAEAFLKQRRGGAPRALRTAVKSRRAKDRLATSSSDYYIFNVNDDGGFVIVSGDDRAVGILGYSDSGHIQESSMPYGLKVLLDDYSEQMARIEGQEESTADGRRLAPARRAIAPLIQTRWGQGAPYNNNAPIKDEEQLVTGCVATSMAQVMYYHQWPTDPSTAIPGYTTRTLKLELGGLSGTTFKWGAMKTAYSSSDTGDAADAVAELMQHCGWSVQMNYNSEKVGGSGAYSESIPFALKAYFGYDAGTRQAKRKCYTYAEWVELIYDELAARRPVLLGGQSAGGGHSFVCDGYEGDDYFHINWGWNGGGDGFFRLAVLQPYERGVGGGSTLDGFSFGQDAVVGIQKPTEGTKGYCLSLEDFYINDYSTNPSKTYSRASANDAFTGISLNFILCSYLSGTNGYDIAVQLVDEGDNVVCTMKEVTDQSLTNNTNYTGPYSDLEIPSSVADGTYYIKMRSRVHGDSKWMECFDGEQYKMTAVVSGNELTINVPLPKATLPASVLFTVNGNKTVGYEQEVVASITGGSYDYRGNVVLRVNGTAVMGKEVEIPAGKTVEAHFSYIPKTAGENVLTLWNSKSDGSQIGSSETVTILDSDAANTQTLAFEPVVNNLTAGGLLYGNAVRATVRLTNPSTENSYVGHVNCSLRIYDSASDEAGSYADAHVLTKNIVIHKSASAEEQSSVDVNFAYDQLDPSKFYRLRFSYLQGSSTASGPIVSAANEEAFAMGEGFALYSQDGAVSIYEKAATINAGTSACVDLRGITSFEDINITPSSNPNCLYLLATDAEVPSALSGCNVVRGTSAGDLTATTLALQDGYDFYTPLSFTATSVSYTRTFTLAANGTSGWNTILLPFDVSNIRCEGVGDVDWFHSSSDTGKNFWVRNFTADGPGTVIFDYADAMTANTPYIIAVPDDRWGSAWQMTGRTVTFSGNSAEIKPTAECSIGGNNFKFCGSTAGSSQKDVYLLNAEGSSFVHGDASTPVPAFRAWFTPVEISALTRPSLAIGSPETTGINSTATIMEQSAGQWFDLSGRKLNSAPMKPGCYINNGKKIVIQ